MFSCTARHKHSTVERVPLVRQNLAVLSNLGKKRRNRNNKSFMTAERTLESDENDCGGQDHRLRAGSGNEKREGPDVRSARILRDAATGFTEVEPGAVAPRQPSTAPGKRESAKPVCRRAGTS